MSGALGKEQLRKLPAIISGRQENAKFFVETFSKIEGISIQQETGNSSWFGFAIICDAGSEMRDKLVEALTNEGVDCRPIVAGDFTKNEVMSYFDYELHGEMKNASLIDNAGFFIGNHHYDVKEKLTSVAQLIEKTLKS
jgi:CDP-6-deoxy-D-xylo-4-hexulose-3-dehydrase